MKKAVGILFLMVSLNVSSQSLVDSLSNSRFSLEDSIAAALVQMAMNNPDLRVIDKQIDANKYEWQSTKAGWLNNINASFNINERNIKGNSNSTTDPATNVFYPRYNLSLNLPMGNFITRGKDAKKARSQYEETKVRREVAVRDLKQAVLTNYQDYQMNKYLLAIQETSVEDEKIVFSQVEQKFKNNTVTVEIFTAASKRVNDALTRRVTLMHDVNVSKYQLEALIGMKLEDALSSIVKKK